MDNSDLPQLPPPKDLGSEKTTTRTTTARGGGRTSLYRNSRPQLRKFRRQSRR